MATSARRATVALVILQCLLCSIRMKINANSLRPGNVIEYKGKLWVVSKISHTQPGKGGAYIQAEMKDIREGTKLNERFRSSEDVERAHLDEKQYQYLYSEGNQLVLMDKETYEQVFVDKDILGEGIAFLEDNMDVTLVSYEESAIFLQLPEEVLCKIVETEAVVKGQTASSSYKPAILENGLRIMVPPFIDSGDRIIVKTSDASYIERAK